MSDAPAAAVAAPAPAPAAEPVLTAAASLFGDPSTQSAQPADADQGAGSTQPTQTAPDKPAEDAPAALALPGKDATPEQWAEFYGKIGRPETPDAYELPVPEGDDGAFAKQMAPVLHKHGVTAEQAKGLAADWNAMMTAQQTEAAAADVAAIAALDVQNKAEAAALKTEWGQQHEANMHFAKLAMQQFIPGETAGQVVSAIESVLGYKGTIQMLHKIGKGLGEHDAAGLGGNRGAVPTKTAAEVLYGNNGG